MRSKGFAFEQLARKHLESKGLKFITQNYHSQRGEIDLIMRDKNSIVFVEVKYRESKHYGDPAETITLQKQKRIAYTASHYLSKNNLWHLISRFDVVTISSSSSQNNHQLSWIKSAFTA